jgi:hypothetical protein
MPQVIQWRFSFTSLLSSVEPKLNLRQLFCVYRHFYFWFSHKLSIKLTKTNFLRNDSKWKMWRTLQQINRGSLIIKVEVKKKVNYKLCEFDCVFFVNLFQKKSLDNSRSSKKNLRRTAINFFNWYDTKKKFQKVFRKTSGPKIVKSKTEGSFVKKGQRIDLKQIIGVICKVHSVVASGDDRAQRKVH